MSTSGGVLWLDCAQYKEYINNGPRPYWTVRLAGYWRLLLLLLLLLLAAVELIRIIPVPLFCFSDSSHIRS